MSHQGLGREQAKWLSRIQAAGGEVEVTVVQTPVVYFGEDNIRIPVRMFESLMERGLFKRVDGEDVTPNGARYRLVGSGTDLHE